MALTKYRLKMFGGLSLTTVGASEALPAIGRKRLALLAILATDSAAPVSRDRLLALLWPEVDELRARNALKQLVYIIRRELGQDTIIEASGGLMASPDRITSDVREFREALSLHAQAEAVSLYVGPFLDGVYLRDTTEFEQWTDARRRELASAHSTLLEELTTATLADGAVLEAVRWARALAASDPFNSRATLLLVQALEEAGDRAGAFQHAERHALLLRTELGVDPPSEVQTVLQRLREPAAPMLGKVRSSAAVGPTAPSGPAGAAHTSVNSFSPPSSSLTVVRKGWHRSRALVFGGVFATTMAAWVVGANFPSAARGPRAGALVRLTLGQSTEMQPALSPDGRWLAFTASARGDARTGSTVRRIFLQPVSGGRAMPLTPQDSTHNQGRPVWSEDGNSIAFMSDGAIYVSPAFGGTALRLRPSGVLSVGGWSHRGRRIAFTDSAGVWTYDLESDSARFVTAAGFYSHSAVWSPDDEALAFVVGTGSTGNVAAASVWIVLVRGGVATRVSDSLHMNVSPAFEPSGRGLFYASNRDGTPDVFFQPLDRSKRARGEPRRLTTGSNATDVAVSADGKDLVFAAAKVRSNIWSAPISDSPDVPDAALRQMTFGDQEVECLSLSPDGRWLLYDSDRSGNQDIYKIPTDGHDAIQLTRNGVDDFCPVLSPSGREILFYSFDGGDRRLFTMPADGGRPRAVLPTTRGEQVWFPNWSPDGNRITFTFGSRGDKKHAAIVSRLPDGAWGERRNISGVNTTSWSPDARYLAASSDSGLELLSADAKRLRVLVPRERLGRWYVAGWSRDASLVYYHTLEVDAGFWAVPVTGGAPRAVARFDNPRNVSRRVEFATDGKRVYFTLAADEASIWRLSVDW
jgi:Tol biopolymer transport system component/DNA-binding SARP family transcriptional activator